MPLHPLFQTMLQTSQTAPPAHTLPLDVIREANLAMLPMLGEPEPVHNICDRVVPVQNGAINIRIYTPDGQGDFPVLLTIHGGGWVAGSLAVFDHISRALANRIGCIVVSIEHRLAPENKFPIPLLDCFAAARWVAEHINEFGGDSTRMAVLGESAGGNIAAALALLARDRGGPGFVYQVLVNPALDYPEPGSESMNQFGKGYGLTQIDILWCLQQYMAGENDLHDPYFLPLRSSNLHELPPALILTAEYDPLRDDGQAYAERLQAAGVPATAICIEGVIHGFFLLTKLIEPANQALEIVAEGLRNAFWKEKAL